MNNDIPNYQKLMRPVLEFYADENEHALREASAHIADLLKLTPEQKGERTSSGTPIYINRVSWAHTYLKRAGLLESVRKGIAKITPRGLQVLETGGDITNKELMQFDEFKEFKKGNSETTTPHQTVSTESNDPSTDLTPEERIDQAIREHKKALAIELLDTLRSTDPVYFETIVLDLLSAMGYGTTRTTKVTNDGGIDGIVNEDALGLSQIYVQAKRYAATNVVNGKEIRDFFGALALNQVSKGVFITTSTFNPSATQATPPHMKVIFVDGKRLAELLIEYNVGVAITERYETKSIDSEYFQFN